MSDKDALVELIFTEFREISLEAMERILGEANGIDDGLIQGA